MKTRNKEFVLSTQYANLKLECSIEKGTTLQIPRFRVLQHWSS